MKEICKTCAHAQPTYKGIACEGKKVKTTGSCERWAEKK